MKKMSTLFVIEYKKHSESGIIHDVVREENKIYININGSKLELYCIDNYIQIGYITVDEDGNRSAVTFF